MLIDPAIRDWVLLPLLALVVVLHFVRLYAMRLMTSDAAPDVVELKQKGLVARSQRLRANGGFVTGQGFAMRKDALLATTGGALGDAAVVDKPPNPLAQPDMLKQQLLGMVMGYGPLMWISSFVTGFLLVQIPFPLTERFKQLTQSGIALAGLPSSYVSGLSLYFIASQALPRVLPLFSVRRLLALGRGLTPLAGGGAGDGGGPDAAEEEARLAAMQMGGMAPGMMPQQGGAGWLAKTAFKGEAGALGVTSYASALVDAERELAAAGAPLVAAKLAAAAGKRKSG